MEMDGSSFVLQRFLLPFGSLVLGVSLMAAPVLWRHAPQQPPADGTPANKDQVAPTADQQKMNPADRALTQQIRKAIHHDKSLSPRGHNIRIFMQEGKVILRGPVQSEDEKYNLQNKAIDAAGEANVTNQLQVTPSH
jgi:BON domain